MKIKTWRRRLEDQTIASVHLGAVFLESIFVIAYLRFSFQAYEQINLKTSLVIYLPLFPISVLMTLFADGFASANRA